MSAQPSQSPKIVVAVAAHKPYRMPDDLVYLPLHVGRALHPEVADSMGPRFAGDDTGSSISERNAIYSELTGLWWLWRNVDADYKGLVHYRRHFRTSDPSRRRARDRFERIASEADFRALIDAGAEVIVPRRRSYYIETMRSHWDHTMPPEQLDVAWAAVAELEPAYLPALDQVLAGTGAHLFNMCVMRADLMDAWCAWLFPVLDETCRRLPPEGYDTFLARYPGRVSELLLDAWLATNGIEPTEMPTTNPEPVNWAKKGGAFLAAKFLGKKYERSF